jgi:hypothetical protein
MAGPALEGGQDGGTGDDLNLGEAREDACAEMTTRKRPR